MYRPRHAKLKRHNFGVWLRPIISETNCSVKMPMTLGIFFLPQRIMSFNIPGYFLDKKTNKLFKITPHGPYSLSELRKRVQREEEEEAAAALAPKLNASRITAPTNINQFLRKRARLSTPRSTMESSRHYFMSQFKTRAKVYLEDAAQKYNNMLVETTNDDYGEIFISHRLGLEHYGYELDPQFHMWKADGGRFAMMSTLSMQLYPNTIEHDGLSYRMLAGTSGGTLWSHQFQRLPPLISDEMKQMFIDEDDTIISSDTILRSPLYSYSGYCHSQSGPKFEQKKDLFWSFSLGRGSVVIGGDQKIYHLNSQYRLQSFRKVKSSIFATHIPPHQQNTCWAGSRNGNISLLDWRHNRNSENYFVHKLAQSSSITNIRTLKNSFELLTVGLDGSMHIWDIRKPKKSRQAPIFSLKGHVNEINRNLGFDLDLENDLVMAAGNDGCVRIWSYADHCNDGKPIWTSRKYASPVPACKFKTTTGKYPRFQDGWENVLNNSSLPVRQCPGILLFGTAEDNSERASIEWLTPIK